MKTTYLVANSQIVFNEPSRIFGIGSIFQVATNDNGKGCYQARFIDESDYDKEPSSFEIKENMTPGQDYWCIPAISVYECETFKEAINSSLEESEEK